MSAVDNVPSQHFVPRIETGHTWAVSGAVEMSCLVKKSKYDERALGSKFKTMQDDITA